MNLDNPGLLLHRITILEKRKRLVLLSRFTSKTQ